MPELSMDTLDSCIKAVEEGRSRPVVRIYLNKDDWDKAKASMQVLSGRSDIPSNSAFGIPVILSTTLTPGMFILEYDTLAGPQLIGWRWADA